MKLARRAPDPDRPSVKQLGRWLAYTQISQTPTVGLVLGLQIVGILLPVPIFMPPLMVALFLLDRRFEIMPYKPKTQWSEPERRYYAVAAGERSR